MSMRVTQMPNNRNSVDSSSRYRRSRPDTSIVKSGLSKDSLAFIHDHKYLVRNPSNIDSVVRMIDL